MVPNPWFCHLGLAPLKFRIEGEAGEAPLPFKLPPPLCVRQGSPSVRGRGSPACTANFALKGRLGEVPHPLQTSPPLGVRSFLACRVLLSWLPAKSGARPSFQKGPSHVSSNVVGWPKMAHREGVPRKGLKIGISRIFMPWKLPTAIPQPGRSVSRVMEP